MELKWNWQRGSQRLETSQVLRPSRHTKRLTHHHKYVNMSLYTETCHSTILQKQYIPQKHQPNLRPNRTDATTYRRDPPTAPTMQLYTEKKLASRSELCRPRPLNSEGDTTGGRIPHKYYYNYAVAGKVIRLAAHRRLKESRSETQKQSRMWWRYRRWRRCSSRN